MNLRIISYIPLLGLMIFNSFIVLAIVFYPGGTYHEPKTSGYDFFNNFLSDLGRTITHGGEINFISAFFFNNAMFISGFLFIIFYIYLPIFFKNNSKLFIYSVLGSVLGVLGSLSFLLVGITPSDLYLKEHILFANNIFYISFPSALIYSFVIIKSKDLSNIYGLGYFVFSITLILYIIILEFGPNIKSEYGLNVQVTAQKFIALCFVFSTWMLAKGLKKTIELD
tara:strand:+ start:6753 stop:7427 length:675 start_codon:yes stop_codon:yes gene_type:complete